MNIKIDLQSQCGKAPIGLFAARHKNAECGAGPEAGMAERSKLVLFHEVAGEAGRDSARPRLGVGEHVDFAVRLLEGLGHAEFGKSAPPRDHVRRIRPHRMPKPHALRAAVDVETRAGDIIKAVVPGYRGRPAIAGPERPDQPARKAAHKRILEVAPPPDIEGPCAIVEIKTLEPHAL